MAKLMIWAALAVLVCGCVGPRPPIPAGEDPDTLVATIAQRGQGGGPPEQEPSEERPSSFHESNVECFRRAAYAAAILISLPGALIDGFLGYNNGIW